MGMNTFQRLKIHFLIYLFTIFMLMIVAQKILASDVDIEPIFGEFNGKPRLSIC